MKLPGLPQVLAGLATLLALSALMGWALDVAPLKHGLSSSVAMNPSTAVCLALLGLEAVRMNALNAHAILANAGQLAILVVVAAALAKLSDLLFGTSFAIDQALFGAALNADARQPNRMAPNTAICLALLGVAMLLMRGDADSRVRNAQLLTLLVLLAGLLALAGNVFSVRDLSGPLQYIPMAFNTAICVCFIAASTLSSKSGRGLLNLIRWESLQTRVTLLSVAVFTSCIWSIALYSNLVLRDELQGQMGTQQFSTVALLAAEIDREMRDRFDALDTIAGEITPAVLANAPVLQQMLESRPVFVKHFNGHVFATRLDGISIVATPFEAPRLGVNYAARDYMVAALQEGKRATGLPSLGKGLTAPTFSMAVPIRNPEGKTIGALVGVTDLGSPHFLTMITDSRYSKTGDYLLSATKQRLIITGSDKKRIMTSLPAPGIIPGLDYYLRGGEGFSVYVNPLGVEVLASAKHIPVAGWTLAAILPTAEAFASIQELNRRLLLIASLLTLLAGLVTWWVMRRQLAPLHTAVHTLAALEGTEQPIAPLPLGRKDEIGALISAFNGLLARLMRRTAALNERNEQLSRFNRVAINRELDMINLKRQVNALARELGRAEPFNLAFADAPPTPGDGAIAATARGKNNGGTP